MITEYGLHELGHQLVEDASNSVVFTAQRGLIDELFPYIYQASKRMSSRAISRWLEEKGIKLSAATISKALRNPLPYWQEIADEVEPSARIFAKAHNLEPMDVLTVDHWFEHHLDRTPTIEGVTETGNMNSMEEYREACSKLHDWFCMTKAAREACLTDADFGNEEPTAKVKDAQSQGQQKC